MSVSKTVRAYRIPTSSNVPCVGEKPFSSASTPDGERAPGFGVADVTPSGWLPVEPPAVVDEVEDPELPQAASTLPAAMPAADYGALGEERAAVDAISHGPP